MVQKGRCCDVMVKEREKTFCSLAVTQVEIYELEMVDDSVSRVFFHQMGCEQD